MAMAAKAHQERKIEHPRVNTLEPKNGAFVPIDDRWEVSGKMKKNALYFGGGIVAGTQSSRIVCVCRLTPLTISLKMPVIPPITAIPAYFRGGGRGWGKAGEPGEFRLQNISRDTRLSSCILSQNVS
jgi:hypothetical protein